MSACPGTTETPADGGAPDGGVAAVTECPAGAYCVFVEDDKIRSCTVKLSIPKGVTVSNHLFGEKIRGKGMQKDGNIGFAFIWKEDKGLTSGAPAVAMMLSKADQEKDLDWKISVSNCFDRVGAAVKSPKIAVRRKN